MTSNEPPNYDGKSVIWKAGQFFRLYWSAIFAILWPVMMAPILYTYIEKPEVRCAFVVLMMAGYWVTECMPLAISSLLPVVLFPAFGVLSTAEVCDCYMNDTIMVFLGGLILALAIEHCNLHMRIALGVMRIVGCSHTRLLGGLLVVTTLLSMWISNTACTAMMIPIIFAVLYELEREGLGKVFKDRDDPNSDPEPTNVTKAYVLATAYASTFGGTSTLVGTGTNLTFKGIFETTFPDSEGINFGDWMLWATPPAFINIFLTWLYMLIFYLGALRPNSQAAREASIGLEGATVANRIIKEKYENLGNMNFHECAVAVLFFLATLLWLLRKPGFMTGWADILSPIDIRDSTPIMFITVLMFLIPKEPHFLNICSKDANKRPKAKSEGLITWKIIETRMPWSLMFLLGGGFAISRGSIASGLSKMVGESLSPLKGQPPFLILCVTLAIVSQVTEFTSNIGIANIMLPVVAQMSIIVKVHPLYLMIPTTMICSFAFRFPAGTPPNAIATVQGHVSVKSLIIGGCGVSMYSLLVIIATFPTWGVFVYDIKGFPDWAHPKNKSI